MACREFHMMCDTHLYSMNTETFLESYQAGDIDVEKVEIRLKDIRKSGKHLSSFD